MSISKSYNKKTNTFYVYDTQYVWSEDKQKKIRVRKCIGKIAEDGSVIPTRAKKNAGPDDAATSAASVSSVSMSQFCGAVIKSLDAVTSALSELKETLLTYRKCFETDKC